MNMAAEDVPEVLDGCLIWEMGWPVIFATWGSCKKLVTTRVQCEVALSSFRWWFYALLMP